MRKAICILLIAMVMLMAMPRIDNSIYIIEQVQDEPEPEYRFIEAHGTRNGGEPDFLITTTSDFDNGTLYNTATANVINGTQEGCIFMDIDGTNNIEINQDTCSVYSNVGDLSGTYYWMAQSFQKSNSFIITAVSIKIGTVSGTPPHIYIEIRNNTGGEPGTVITETEKKAYNEVSSGWEMFNITKSTELNASTTYWMVYRLNATPSTDENYAVAFQNADVYADGNRAYSVNQGSSWTQSSAQDMGFKIYSQTYINTSLSMNPILVPEGDEDLTAWGSCLRYDNTYHYYYSYHNSTDYYQIGHATSIDGWNWTKDTVNNPVLNESGTDNAWVPMVWVEGSTWYMVYSYGEGTSPDIYLAHSSDGVSWIKDGKILDASAGEWDQTGVENWGIIKVGSVYYLWYNTMSNDISGQRRVGLATTTELPDNWNSTSFTKDSNNPIFEAGRFCVFPFKRGSYYYLLVPHYTSGTDYSEIELYKDSNPTFHSGNRTKVGNATKCPASGWNSEDQDTPYIFTDDIGRDSYVGAENELWCYAGGYDGLDWTTGLFIEEDIDTALTLSNGEWNESKVRSYWLDINRTMPGGKRLSNLTVEYSNITSTHKIRIELLSTNYSMLWKSEYITSGASKLYNISDFGTINTNLKIKVEFYGNGSSTAIVSELKGYFENYSQGNGNQSLNNITLIKDFWNFIGYPNSTEVNVTSLYSEIPNCTTIIGKNVTSGYWYTYYPDVSLKEYWNISYGDGLYVSVSSNSTWQVYNYSLTTNIPKNVYAPVVFSNPTDKNASTIHSSITNITALIGKNSTGYWFTYAPIWGIYEDWAIKFGDGLFILASENTTWNHI